MAQDGPNRHAVRMKESSPGAVGERDEQAAAQLDAAAWLIEWLPPGARVLDLGCGTGRPTAVQLDQAGLCLVGVDQSEDLIRQARRRAPHAEFHCRDLRDLSGLGEFEAVVSFFSLMLLPKPDAVALLGLIQQVLRGPKLLVLAGGDFDARPATSRAEAKLTAWPAGELVSVVEEAGFKILRTDEVEGGPGRVERQIFIRARSAR